MLSSKRIIGYALVVLAVAFNQSAVPSLAQSPAAMARLRVITNTGSVNNQEPTLRAYEAEDGIRRFCIKTFPWPQGRNAETWQSMPLADIEGLRRRVRASVPGNTVTQSVNPIQRRLFADLIYAMSLKHRGEYSRLRSFLRDLRSQSYVVAGDFLDDPYYDELEVHTYFRSNTIRKYLRLLEYEAARNLVSTADGVERYKWLEMLAEYLEHPRAYEAAFRPHGPEFREAFFSRRAAESTVALLGLELGRMSPQERRVILNEIPGIQGFAVTSQSVDLYLGREKITLVRVSRVSRRVTYLDERAAGAYFQTVARQAITDQSNNDMTFIHVSRAPGGAFQVLQPSGTSRLSASAVAAMQIGQPLPDNHPLHDLLDQRTPLVVWRDPFMIRSEGETTAIQPAVYALQRAHPAARLVTDDYTPGDTEDKVRRIVALRITDPTQLTAVIDRAGLSSSLAVIENLRAELAEAGVEIVEYAPQAALQVGSGRGVIVITGRSNSGMQQFVRRLGEMGVFANNYVIFASCNTPLSNELVSEMNERFDAVGVLQPQGLINPADVEDFIDDLVQRVSAGEGDFMGIVQRALVRVRAVWNVSFISRLEESHA